jgi:plastocyanin
MRSGRRLAVSTAAALLLTACAGAESAPTPSEADVAATSPTESASPSPSPAAAASEPQSLDDEYGRGGGSGSSGGGGGSDAGGGDTATVMIMGFDFSDDITVAAGTTVTFVNHDGGAHTVTEGSDGVAAADAAFDEEVPAGGMVEVSFDEPGTYRVTCLIHPTMNMTVTVED